MLRLPLRLLVICCALTATAFAQEPAPRDIVTDGCSLVSPFNVMSATVATSENLYPLIWGSELASSSDTRGLQGTKPAPAWLGTYGSGRVAIWDGHPGFFGSGADGRDDNDRLRIQLIDWLRDNGSMAFARGHGEKPMDEVLSGSCWQHLLDSAADPHELDGELTTENLTGSGLLVIGSSWQRITDSELDAVEDFVLNGGGLLVIGIGWAYSGYADDPDPDFYIPNRLGERFGWRVQFGTIKDPGTPLGEAGAPAFSVLPLEDYRPARIHVLRGLPQQIDDVVSQAAADPQDIFVVEGKYTGLCLPNAYWAELDSVSGILELLDSVYLSHNALIGNANPPYGGERIWFVPQVSDEPGWYMHSGNPVVYKAHAAEDIVRTYNTEGRLGWGIVHELGHNMHISSCGNNMVPDGTGENWANVWSVWTNNAMGWPNHENYGRAGGDYHEHPDYAKLSSDNWILLGCLDMIWQRYGWDGMQAFLTDVATRRAAGEKLKDNAERQRLLIEGMSIGYGIDFSELFAHWGFPVSDETRELLSKYPKNDIPIP